MDNPLQFSQLSPGRQTLVRLCQSINYGHIQNLKVEDHEPILQGTSVIATTDIRLDAEDSGRVDLEVDDFVLCEEVTRLIALFDRLQNATISKIEVLAGLPRRISLEHHFSEKKIWHYLPVVRQGGSRDPVRQTVVDPENEDGNREIAGHGLGCGGMAVFGRTLGRREYPETGCVGDCFGSLGPTACEGR
jgi:hypothetical protein